MRNIIIAAVAAVVGLGTAQAADLGPSFKEAAPVYVPTWSGFYVGAAFGFGVGSVDRNNRVRELDTDGTTIIYDGILFGGGDTREGAIYSGHIGYNWQRTNWVFGVEAAINGVGTNNNHSRCVGLNVGEFNCDSDNNWYATFVGRIGYAQGPVMIYGLGGVAWADNNNRFREDGYVRYWPDGVWHDDNGNDAGWVAGIGLEYALNPHCLLRVEYSHVDFSNGNNSFDAVDNDGYTWHFDNGADLSFDVIKIGASYKFGDRYVEPLK